MESSAGKAGLVVAIDDVFLERRYAVQPAPDDGRAPGRTSSSPGIDVPVLSPSEPSKTVWDFEKYPMAPILGVVKQWPWRCIGAFITMKGSTRGGSGLMIGPRHVLTAGHVLWEGPSTLPKGVTPLGRIPSRGYTAFFKPGQFDTSTYPNGQHALKYACFAYREYESNGQTAKQWLDMAIAVLEDRQETANLGWWGMCTGKSSWLKGKQMRVWGYPDEFCDTLPVMPKWPPDCGGYMWTSRCPIKDVTGSELRYECSTLTGMSGGPIRVLEATGSCDFATFGIHLGPSPDGNYAFRLTLGWIDAIRRDVICAPGFRSNYASYAGCQ